MKWKCNACGGTYLDTQRDGMIYQHVCGPLPADAQGTALERPNQRNENMVLDFRERAHAIVSEGAGVSPIDGQKETEPQWITHMRTKYKDDTEREL